MHKYAIIVAGGAGTRMGADIPKQFLLLDGKPVIWHAIKAFTDAYDAIEVILVLPRNHLEKGQEIVKEFGSHKITVTAGGETRFHSVKNGLQFVKKDSLIFVHDGVRCLISRTLIDRCYQAAIEKGTAIPAVPCKDSVRLITERGNEGIDRARVMLVQTPQTFLGSILLPAFESGYTDKFTDEASVVEAYGHAVSLVEGEETNIKITRPVDLLLAESIIRNR